MSGGNESAPRGLSIHLWIIYSLWVIHNRTDHLRSRFLTIMVTKAVPEWSDRQHRHSMPCARHHGRARNGVRFCIPLRPLSLHKGPLRFFDHLPGFTVSVTHRRRLPRLPVRRPRVGMRGGRVDIVTAPSSPRVGMLGRRPERGRAASNLPYHPCRHALTPSIGSSIRADRRKSRHVPLLPL